MTDLACEECGWTKAGFDNGTEIADYMAETELIETHFADQDCPKCGAEESLEVYYRMCTDCGEAEVDCTCDVETRDIPEPEAEALREEVMSLVKDKMENQDMTEEQRKMAFKENDLRRMASKLITKHFGGSENE